MLWLMYYEATVAEREDPLNPDEERKLFERLSMEKDDYDMLQAIRRMMKHIIRDENAQTTQNKRTPGNDSGPF